MPTGSGEAVTNRNVGMSIACAGAKVTAADNVNSRIIAIVEIFILSLNNLNLFYLLD
jgi:hypothetical protein